MNEFIIWIFGFATGGCAVLAIMQFHLLRATEKTLTESTETLLELKEANRKAREMEQTNENL